MERVISFVAPNYYSVQPITLVNRTMYLRCFTSEQPSKWINWFSWVEYCYNTNFHSSLKATPFEVVYGRPPPHLLSYCARSSLIDANEIFEDATPKFASSSSENEA